MQYPPQQPANQPYYPPSEVYVPEQPLQYAVQNNAQPQAPAQEITIYAHRAQAITRAIICLICLLVIVFIIPFMAIVSAQSDLPISFADLLPLFIIVLPAAALVGWITWSALAMALSDKPLLRINQQGIHVGRMPMLSEFSISWAEIGILFPSRSLYKYLCIAPKNADYFLKTHFKGFERFMRSLNSMIGSPLYIPQIYLSKPVEEILQELYHMYAKELSYYHVQIRS